MSHDNVLGMLKYFNMHNNEGRQGEADILTLLPDRG